MNKKNKILVGCLALLLALSVGYALFSDTITINGTATAKGSFDMTATCQTGIPGSLESTAYAFGIKTDGGYENDSCEVVDDKVSLKTDFLYPGARRNFTVKITNTGTIDAIWDDSKLIIAEKLCVADDLEGNNLTCSTTPDKDGGMVKHKNFYANHIFYTIAVEKPDGSFASEEDYGDIILDSENGIYVIKPGYSVYIVNSIYISHFSTVVASGKINVTFDSSVEIPYTQKTN